MNDVAIELVKDGSGIFSNFLRIMDWLWYHDRSKTPLLVNWKDQMDPHITYKEDLLKSIVEFDIDSTNFKFSRKSTTNQWVEYCNLGLSAECLSERRRTIPFYDKYNLQSRLKSGGYFYTTPEVYREKDFFLLRNLFFDLFQRYVSFNRDFLNSPNSNIVPKGSKTLGVHLRYMGHYCHNVHQGPAFSHGSFYQDNARFIQKVFEEQGYDYIYVACDVSMLIEELKNLIPSGKLLFLNYDRCPSDTDWRSKRDLDMHKETLNVFHDFVNLNKASHAVISTSNLVFALLCYNPKMSYEFYPMLNNLHGM